MNLSCLTFRLDRVERRTSTTTLSHFYLRDTCNGEGGVMSSRWGLWLVTLIYFISSLGSIAIVKFLNYQLCFHSWVVVALLSCSTWILSCPLHYGLMLWEDVTVGVTGKQLRLYFVIAIGLSLVELLNSLSMSVLPGSWYAFLKGSDVGFSMALSHWILEKSYHWGQIVGAGFVMGGIGMVFALGHMSLPSDDVQPVSLTVAALLCLAGAYLNSACSVIVEATLKQTLHEEESRILSLQNVDHSAPSKILLANAYFMWTSLFSFLLLIIPAVVSGQLQGILQHADEQAELCHADEATPPSKYVVTTVLIGMLSLLTGSRFGERLSKHWICVADSAVTFHMVQAARRISAVFLLALLFDEALPSSMVLGSLCSAVGFGLHSWYDGPVGALDLAIPRHQYEMVATTIEKADALLGQHEGIHKE